MTSASSRSGTTWRGSCVDGVVPFDKSAPADVREAQFAAAYEAEPDFYGVISKEAWAAPGCLGFAAIPVHRVDVGGPSDVPRGDAGGRRRRRLILGGRVRRDRAGKRAPDGGRRDGATARTSGSPPPATIHSCGRSAVVSCCSASTATLDAGDTSCQEEPAGGWWVPGSFPARAAQAPQATQVDGQRAPGLAASPRHGRRLDDDGQRPAQLLRAG